MSDTRTKINVPVNDVPQLVANVAGVNRDDLELSLADAMRTVLDTQDGKDTTTVNIYVRGTVAPIAQATLFRADNPDDDTADVVVYVTDGYTGGFGV